MCLLTLKIIMTKRNKVILIILSIFIGLTILSFSGVIYRYATKITCPMRGGEIKATGCGCQMYRRLFVVQRWR